MRNEELSFLILWVFDFLFQLESQFSLFFVFFKHFFESFEGGELKVCRDVSHVSDVLHHIEIEFWILEQVSLEQDFEDLI